MLLTIFPFSGGRIDESKQLERGDCLRVEVHPHRLLLHEGVRPVQAAQDLALARASVANDEDGVTHMAQLLQLDYLQDEVIFSLQPLLLQHVIKRTFKKIESLGFLPIVKLIFSYTQNGLKKNFHSKKVNLKLFDFSFSLHFSN